MHDHTLPDNVCTRLGARPLSLTVYALSIKPGEELIVGKRLRDVLERARTGGAGNG